MRSGKLSVRLGVAVCMFGAGLFVFFTKGYGAPAGPALNMPLQADGRWAQSEPFRAEGKGTHRVSLKLARRFEHHDMECLADVDGVEAPVSCDPAFAPAKVEWRLLRDGVVLPIRTQGAHGGEYSNDSVGRSLGWADLEPGAHYIVQARLSRGATNLSKTSPRIVVGYDHLDDLVVLGLLWSLAALALAGAGIWMLARIGRSLMAQRPS